MKTQFLSLMMALVKVESSSRGNTGMEGEATDVDGLQVSVLVSVDFCCSLMILARGHLSLDGKCVAGLLACFSSRR